MDGQIPPGVIAQMRKALGVKGPAVYNDPRYNGMQVQDGATGLPYGAPANTDGNWHDGYQLNQHGNPEQGVKNFHGDRSDFYYDPSGRIVFGTPDLGLSVVNPRDGSMRPIPRNKHAQGPINNGRPPVR